MQDDQAASSKATADRVIELEEEVEASGFMVQGDALHEARTILHKWVDEMTGVVVSPGLGRVTVIHGGNRPSTISSAELPFIMSKPLA